MSILQLAVAKGYLNLSAGTSNDGEVQDFIDAAERAIGRKVGPLAIATFTERVPGGRRMLEVRKLPLVEVVSLTPAFGSPIDVTTLDADPAGTIGPLSSYGGFFAARYTVVYRAGWQDPDDPDATPLPADILQAVKELVRHLWRTQRGSGVTRPGSSASPEVANTLAGAAYSFPIRVEQLIGPYVPLGSG